MPASEPPPQFRVRSWKNWLPPAVGAAARRLGALITAALLIAASGFSDDTPKNHALPVTALTQAAPPTITLSWPAATDATEYRVARKKLDATAWGADTVLPGTATQYVDSSATPGVTFEYAVYKVTAHSSAPGFICAGIDAPLIENRGAILLLVDKTHAAALAAEIARLGQDLAGDGWKVVRREVARNASPSLVKLHRRPARHTAAGRSVNPRRRGLGRRADR